MIKLFNDDCLKVLKSEEFKELIKNKRCIIVTDPPFNIGLKYKSYKDKLKYNEYYNMLYDVFTSNQYEGLVIIHYPEQMFEIAKRLDRIPTKVVSWVYNSNTAKQHRDIAYFGVKPIFKQVLQPYKNPNDKRIRERIANGKLGGKLYDWWNINQVKNVSKKGITHPCIMPLEVMKNTVGILPKGTLIIDPFMGSGTTGLACKELGYDFIGIELDKTYFEECKKRLE